MFCSLCLHRVHDLKFKMLPKPAVVFGDLKKIERFVFMIKFPKKLSFQLFMEKNMIESMLWTILIIRQYLKIPNMAF